MMAHSITPLWLSSHLPLKGGDHAAAWFSPITDAGESRPASPQPISPLEGEMVGRPEGGAAPHVNLGAAPHA